MLVPFLHNFSTVDDIVFESTGWRVIPYPHKLDSMPPYGCTVCSSPFASSIFCLAASCQAGIPGCLLIGKGIGLGVGVISGAATEAAFRGSVELSPVSPLVGVELAFTFGAEAEEAIVVGVNDRAPVRLNNKDLSDLSSFWRSCN